MSDDRHAVSGYSCRSGLSIGECRGLVKRHRLGVVGRFELGFCNIGGCRSEKT